MKWKSVAVIGVGLIGGSVGMALRQRGLAEEVVGIGRRQESLKLAKQVGAVTKTTIDLAKGVAGSELIVVATPVSQIVAHVKAAAKTCPEGALITDCGSTKAEIVEQIGHDLGRGVRFLGGHPLAGSERSGPTEAHPDLFDKRAVVITPTSETSDDDFNTLLDFWTDLGARAFEMSPIGHDRAVASTSHIPHALAAALATSTPTEFFPLAGGGLLDTTRIAAGDPELWQQIFLSNRRNVLLAMEPLEEAINAFRSAMIAGDKQAIVDFLTRGKRNRDALGS